MATEIVAEIRDEIDRSEEQSGPLHSLHEGLAALREDYKELEDAIFRSVQTGDNTKDVRAKAIQVAAVATRIAMAVSPVPNSIY